MNILGIETSCDETAAAVVQDGRHVLSSIVASQMKEHRPFHGVVPELASRAHVERINGIIERAIHQADVPIDRIAVTTGPGLVGSLLVGIVAARTMAWVQQKPIIGINHLEGHLYSALAEHPHLKPPFLGLVVSGGHTELHIFKGHGRYQTLGRTRDDAAGEAFDKVAHLLGLSYPGGPAIQKMAVGGNPQAIRFPRARIPGTWDFSFSGLKTALLNFVEKNGRPKGQRLKDVCASFQEAVVDVLIQKTFDAAEKYHIQQIVLGGGVAANQSLRDQSLQKAREFKKNVYLPALAFCTDNAAMIASAAYFQLKHRKNRNLFALEVNPSWEVTSWS